MRVQYAASADLPRDVAVALVEGQHESTVLIAEDATGREIAEALQEVLGDGWMPSSWIYVGACGPRLRAVR